MVIKMFKVIKNYLDKNLFYISVIITGTTSFLLGIFYTLFKSNVFERASNEFLEGTGILGSYVTVQSNMPSGINYFVIGLVLGIIFFFLTAMLLRLYLKKDYFKIFNLLSILNSVLIVGLIISCIFINISYMFSYIVLIISLLLYLFIFYKSLDEIFDVNLKQRIISLLVFIGPIIIILILLKLFV